MPLSIPKGLTRQDVLQALADLDSGVDHPFGPPTGYELVHEGKRYAPKAVIGLACRSMLGRFLPAPKSSTSGGPPGSTWCRGGCPSTSGWSRSSTERLAEHHHDAVAADRARVQLPAPIIPHENLAHMSHSILPTQPSPRHVQCDSAAVTSPISPMIPLSLHRLTPL